MRKKKKLATVRTINSNNSKIKVMNNDDNSNRYK